MKRTKVEEELRRTKKKGVLNIQPLAIRLLVHLPSSSKCAEGKAYNVKIQFTQMIIQDINTIGTYAVEFFCKSKQCWRAKKHIKLGATSINLVCI